MPYVFVDHTGDVAVRVHAPTLEGLFADAARALTATLVDPEHVRPVQQQTIVLEAGAVDLLLVDWLNDLVYRFEVDGWLVASTDVRLQADGGRWRLDATARGEPFDEGRHAPRVLVKGVTYHQLAITRSAGEYETLVVFDI